MRKVNFLILLLVSFQSICASELDLALAGFGAAAVPAFLGVAAPVIAHTAVNGNSDEESDELLLKAFKDGVYTLCKVYPEITISTLLVPASALLFKDHLPQVETWKVVAPYALAGILTSKGTVMNACGVTLMSEGQRQGFIQSLGCTADEFYSVMIANNLKENFRIYFSMALAATLGIRALEKIGT